MKGKQIAVVSTAIPNTNTDYLVLATNEKSMVIFACRYTIEDLKADNFRITISGPPNAYEQHIMVQNQSSDTVMVYVALWDGRLYSTVKAHSILPRITEKLQVPSLPDTGENLFRVMAVSEKEGVLVYSRWFNSIEFQSLNWTVALPERTNALWDSLYQITVVNDTNYDLYVHVYTGDQVWRKAEEGGYRDLGLVGKYSEVRMPEYRVSGMFVRHFVNIINADDTQGIVSSRRMLTDKELYEIQSRVVFTIPGVSVGK